VPRITFTKSPFFWKISLSNFLLVMILSVGFCFSIWVQLEAGLEEDIHDNLLQNSAILMPFAETILENPTQDNFNTLLKISQNAQVRITVMNQLGTVIADSSSLPNEMTNHLDRKEILQAKAEGVGFSRRYSDTLKTNMAYVARSLGKTDDIGGYIRLAYSEAKIQKKTSALLWTLLITLAIAIFFTLIVGTVMARSVTIPLGEMQDVCNAMRQGDYSQRVTRTSTDELGTLGITLNHLCLELTEKIADLKLEKTQMRTTLAGMVEGLISLDKSGVVRFCNQAAYSLLHSPESDCRGSKLDQIEGFSKLALLFGKVNEQNQFIEEELKVRSEDFYKTLEVRINYFKKPDAEGYLILIHDISHLRHLERIRRDFVANVSHELKTPLTAIKGYSETLLNGAISDPEVAVKFVEKIERNAKQLNDIVKDLLNLASIENHESEVQSHPVQIKNIVDAVIKRYEDAINEKAISIESVIPHGAKVMGDEESLTLIFDNLISNAIRYSPGKGRISIETRNSKDNLLTIVSDTGLGIPEKDLNKIFERFYRVDKARSKKLGGTGLGLSIVKHLVVRLGGEIQVQSVLGLGSQFIVKLPSI